MRAERRPALGVDGGTRGRERDRRRAVAEHGRKREDGEMAGELAEEHLPAAHRIAQQEQHRAALHLAHDRIMRDQERDERQQKDGEARQADDDHVERAHADIAGRRAAEERERERERREQQGRRENPAVAKALLDLLAGDKKDVPHPAASLRTQEVSVKVIESGWNDGDVLDRAAVAGRASDELDLSRSWAASNSTTWPLSSRQLHRGPDEGRSLSASPSGHGQADLGRQLRNAPQLVDGSVRHDDPLVHDDDALGALLELGERVRREHDRRAAIAKLAARSS